MSDRAPDGTSLATSLPSGTATSNSSHVSLSDVSPQDKPWDKHRSFADAVEGLYRGSEFDSYSTRIHFCSELLQFGLVDDDGNALKLKLRSARFCRVRHCPVCQWRRSLMWKAKAYKLLPKIIERHPKHRWLFLTLTQKNVPIKDLRATLMDMNRSFQRFSQLKAFPAVGWLRSTEITRGRDGNAHPHFHCLLMVPPGYFAGQNYIKQSEWMEMWRKSMRLNYDPVIDVRAIKQGSQPMQLIPELLKYCTKESDMVNDREWLLELTRQMNKMRSIATGGILKEYLKELEDEPEDLIGKDDEVALPDEIALYFGWKRVEKKYQMMENF
jgi:plasmid rolling circle replication initiator protein Rep